MSSGGVVMSQEEAPPTTCRESWKQGGTLGIVMAMRRLATQWSGQSEGRQGFDRARGNAVERRSTRVTASTWCSLWRLKTGIF